MFLYFGKWWRDHQSYMMKSEQVREGSASPNLDRAGKRAEGIEKDGCPHLILDVFEAMSIFRKHDSFTLFLAIP